MRICSRFVLKIIPRLVTMRPYLTMTQEKNLSENNIEKHLHHYPLKSYKLQSNTIPIHHDDKVYSL